MQRAAAGDKELTWKGIRHPNKGLRRPVRLSKIPHTIVPDSANTKSLQKGQSGALCYTPQKSSVLCSQEGNGKETYSWYLAMFHSCDAIQSSLSSTLHICVEIAALWSSELRQYFCASVCSCSCCELCPIFACKLCGHINVNLELFAHKNIGGFNIWK